jgi:putative phosphoesterase
MRIGVISDTHGLVRPEALAALRGSEHILHAGDVGDPAILDELRKLAPVTAIRGNVDVSGPAPSYRRRNWYSSGGAASTCCTTGMRSIWTPWQRGLPRW